MVRCAHTFGHIVYIVSHKSQPQKGFLLPMCRSATCLLSFLRIRSQCPTLIQLDIPFSPPWLWVLQQVADRTSAIIRYSIGTPAFTPT